MADGGIQTAGAVVGVIYQLCQYIARYKDAEKTAKQLKATVEGLKFALEEASDIVQDRRQLASGHPSDAREARRIEQVEGTAGRVERALKGLIKQVYGTEDVTKYRRPAKVRIRKAINAFLPQSVVGLQAQLQLDLTIMQTSLILLQISDTSILRSIKRAEPDPETVETSSRTFELARTLCLHQSRAREICQTSHCMSPESRIGTLPSEGVETSETSQDGEGSGIEDLKTSMSEAGHAWLLLTSGFDSEDGVPESAQDASEAHADDVLREVEDDHVLQSYSDERRNEDFLNTAYPLSLVKRHVASYRRDVDSLKRDRKWKQSERCLKKLVYWSREQSRLSGEPFDGEMGIEEELSTVLMELGQQDEALQRTTTLESSSGSTIARQEDALPSISLRSARLHQLKALLYFDKYLKSNKYRSGRKTEDLISASTFAKSAFGAHYAFFQTNSNDLNKSRLRASGQLLIDILNCMEDVTESNDIRDEISNICGVTIDQSGEEEADEDEAGFEGQLANISDEGIQRSGSQHSRDSDSAQQGVHKQDFASEALSADLDRAPQRRDNSSRRALLHAVKANDNREVSRLLHSRSNGDVNFADDTGMTALHYAARDGNTDTANALLSNDADVNIKTGEGETALLLAVNNIRIEVIRVLLKERSLNIMERFMDDWTILHYAVEEDETETTVALLEHPASKDLIDAQDIDGWTALHYCAQNGRLAQSKVLLEGSLTANVNVQTFHDKVTPLHLVLGRNRTKEERKLIDLLLNAGPNIDAAEWTTDQRKELRRNRERRDSAVKMQNDGETDDQGSTSSNDRRSTISFSSVFRRRSTNGSESRRRDTVS